LIADTCAQFANAAFAGHMGSGAAATLIGMYAFAWQIYGDFSGYSDMARGSAQLLGFHFMVNFRQPYLATSLQDFWRRWHISLSTWLRDYLYIPLGGSRRSNIRTYINLSMTMLLGGLWHGANWTFVIWGALHGAGLALERRLNEGKEIVAKLSPMNAWVRRIAVFHLVCVAWVFFRANSFGEAMSFLSGLTRWQWMPEYVPAIWMIAAGAAALLAIDLHLEKSEQEYLLQSRSPWLRVGAAGAMVLTIAVLAESRAAAFIYFQF
jgi:D-alanyl-lipoteichoic acid acyltransferase DltB (MBOAT superfamily)